MQNLDLSFAQDPNTLSLALIAGLVPALLWITFWSREKKERPRGMGTLFLTFLAGVFMVILALPVEKFVALFSTDATTLTVLWAASEECLKFLAFGSILLFTSWIEVPIDYPVYAMVVALGFAGFENALYFLQPLQAGTTTILILSGSMRFLGTTLMHAAVTCLPGTALGFAYFLDKRKKIYFALGGLALAILGHSLFNLFIPEQPNIIFFTILACLWLLTIVLMVLFEKLRAKGSDAALRAHYLGIIAGLESRFTTLVQKAGMQPTDAEAILAGLTKMGIAPDAPEHAELDSLIEAARGHYGQYLVNEGAKKEDALRASRNLIPDTVSPRAFSGVFSVLKQ